VADSLNVTLNRLLQPEDVKCPAGVQVGDADVRCNIEQHTLRGHLEPDSIEGFCCSSYETCSSWLAMKKVEEKGGDLRKIIASIQSDASKRRTEQQLREARLRTAQRLMVEDSAEGREFRKMFKVGEFDPRNRG
jgi:hypothetical protein